jgi:hypothetical protein
LEIGMRASRGRRAAAVAGTLVLGLGLVPVHEWPRVVLEYHASRVEAASTWQEARPRLGSLARDAARPDAAPLIARKLGSGNGMLTFWVFEAVMREAQVLGPQLLEAVSLRIDQDPRLLSLWSHYLCWRGSPFTDWFLGGLRDEIYIQLVVRGRSELAGFVVPPHFNLSGDKKIVFVFGEDIDWECVRQVLRLHYRAIAWLVGMEALVDRPFRDSEGKPYLPQPDGLSRPEDFDAMKAPGKAVEAWLKENQQFLQFDPREGRCNVVKGPTRRPGLIPLEAMARSVAKPPVPFPGWRGTTPAKD